MITKSIEKLIDYNKLQCGQTVYFQNKKWKVVRVIVEIENKHEEVINVSPSVLSINP